QDELPAGAQELAREEEPKAGPRFALGRHQRLEELAAHRRLDSTALVGDHQLDLVAGGAHQELDGARLVAHGVARVGDEVDERVQDAPPAGYAPRQVLLHGGLEVDTGRTLGEIAL